MKYLFYIPLFIIVSACSSTKKLNKGPVPSHSDISIYNALISRNIDFKWLNVKMNTRLESPDENVSGSMIVRMQKDSAIWISVKKFGLEFAKVFVDQNKYTVLYKFEGMYEEGAIDQINEVFSIAANFDDVQQLMFGNVLLPEIDQITISKDSIYYVVKATINSLKLNYFINAYTLELDKMSIIDQMNRMATAYYSDYRNISGFGKFSFERKFDFPYSERENASITLSLSDVEINIPKEIKFSIPDSYVKIY